MTRHLRRGQRASDRSWFLLSCGSEAQTQVVRLGSKCGNLSHQIRSPLAPPIALSVPSTEASKFATRSMMLFFLTRASPNLSCDIASLSIYAHTLGIFIYLFIYTFCSVFVCMCVGTCATAYMWESENNYMGWVLFCHVGSRDRTQILRLAIDLPLAPALHLDIGFLCWSLFNA